MSIEELVEQYHRERSALDWLDANCWIGVPPRGLLRPVEGLDQTRRLLARYGMRRAVLAHAAAKDYDPEAGNRLLVEAIRGDDALLGAATLAPDGSSPDALRRRVLALIADKIRLVRLFPRSHNYVLSAWCAGPWLSVLEELRVPVVLWHTETSWDELAELCRLHPRLPVILEGPNRKLLYHNRVYYRLLEQFPNFHLEIHNLAGYLGLDDVVRRFGSRRLIFGTYFPYQDPNTAMMLVTHGDLTPEDRQNIAHRNLERLIDEVHGG